MKSLLTFGSLLSVALAASRTSAPSGCINVAKSGGKYSTIQAAVNSLSTSSTADQCIFIGQGTYNEQVLVPARSAKLTIYGYSTDTASYSGNGATITASKSQANGLSNDETATLRVKAAKFKMYNVNVNNGYGKGSQAVALSAYADSGYYGCAFTGFQDTLLSQSGNQLYARCKIQGATDFIFGQSASSWFEKCDLRVLAASLGYVTGKICPSQSPPLTFTNELPPSKWPCIFILTLLLCLQQLQRRRCIWQLGPQRSLLPRPSMGCIRPCCVPKHRPEQRHQQRRLAQLEHR